jgi:predicted nucleic acid-binding protein
MNLLDSSVLIELFRKKNKGETLFYDISQTYENLCISAITHYEIGIGNRKSHFEYWNSLLAHLTVIPFDQTCSDSAIKIYTNLLQSNKMIDLADILIGATAIAHNIPIATLNIKHFERIKDLEIIK